MLEEFQTELERAIVFYKVRPSERLWNRFKTLCQDCETLKPNFIKTSLFGDKQVPLLHFVLVKHQLFPLAKIVIQLQPESVYYVSEGTQFQTVLSHIYREQGEEWQKMINLVRRLDTFTKSEKSTKMISEKSTKLIAKKKTKRSQSLSFTLQKKENGKARAKSLSKPLKPLLPLVLPLAPISQTNPQIECDWPFCGQSLPFDEFQAHSRCHVLNSVNAVNPIRKVESEEEMLSKAISESLKLPS